MQTPPFLLLGLQRPALLHQTRMMKRMRSILSMTPYQRKRKRLVRRSQAAKKRMLLKKRMLPKKKLLKLQNVKRMRSRVRRRRMWHQTRLGTPWQPRTARSRSWNARTQGKPTTLLDARAVDSVHSCKVCMLSPHSKGTVLAQ